MQYCNKSEADFYPEAEAICGHIVVDLQSEEIIALKNVPGYSCMYPGHAGTKLIELAKEHSTEKERMVMWY